MDIKQLKELQSLPLKYKVKITEQRIREWYEHWGGKVYVSFSGGKDSTVLLHIARSIYPNIPAVFVDTGLEYPEIRRFVKQTANVTWLKPKMRFQKVITEYGYPVISKKNARCIYDIQNPTPNNEATRKLVLTGMTSTGKYQPSFMLPQKWHYLINAPFKISNKCCDIMKKAPFGRYGKETGRYPMMGVMAIESNMREIDYLTRGGCNAFTGNDPKSMPLGFWLEQDIWDYIHKLSVPYSKIYDMGYERTGCMFCMFGVHLEPRPNRFERMKLTHPAQWKYCMFKLGLADVLDYIGVQYGQQMTIWEMIP